MAYALSPSDNTKELLKLIYKDFNPNEEGVQEGTPLKEDNVKKTPVASIKPCEDQPKYLNELINLVEENKLQTETQINFIAEDNNDAEKRIQNLILMWVTNYCNVYVAEKMKLVDEILITNEEFQLQLLEVSDQCDTVKRRVLALFGCDLEEELQCADYYDESDTKLPSEIELRDLLQKLNMLLKKCANIPKTPAKNVQKELVSEIMQRYFDEYLELVKEYQLACEAVMKVDVESDEEPDLGKMSVCQKKIMKWSANYCDFYIAQEIKTANDLLIMNQDFYETRNEIIKLCDLIESAINKTYKDAKTNATSTAANNSMTVEKNYVLDPLTLRPITKPVTNSICGHVYDHDSVDQIFRRLSIAVCPYIGCPNRSFTRQDLDIDLDAWSGTRR